MPIIIGFAHEEDVEHIKFPFFKLDESEASNYGLTKFNDDDNLYLTYIPIQNYDNMSPENWDNTYVMDERNIDEKFLMGF